MVHSTYRILPRAYLRRIYLYIIHIVKTCPVLSSSLKLEPLNYLFFALSITNTCAFVWRRDGIIYVDLSLFVLLYSL